MIRTYGASGAGSPSSLEPSPKPPMMPTPLTSTFSSGGAVTWMPPMMVMQRMTVSRSSKRASRRSISPPPHIANAVNIRPTVQRPFRLNPPHRANAPLEVALPPILAGQFAAEPRKGAGADEPTGATTEPGAGRSWTNGSNSPCVRAL